MLFRSKRNSENELNLFRRLDQKLLACFFDLFRNSVLPDRPTLLTLEVFLCGLYARYPEETKEFFRDPERFAQLLRKFYPEPIRNTENLPPEEFADHFQQKWRAVAGSEMPAVTSGGVPGLDLPLDSSLVEVLRKAARIAVAAGRERAGISEFISAFSLDHELVTRLYEETGLLPKGHLGPDSESGGPHDASG